MKKILSIVFAFVLIFSCFAISTVAFSSDSIIYEDKAYFDSQPVVTFSDDFKKMYVDDERFKKNIDKYGEGTSEFASEGIRIYVEKK